MTRLSDIMEIMAPNLIQWVAGIATLIIVCSLCLYMLIYDHGTGTQLVTFFQTLLNVLIPSGAITSIAKTVSGNLSNKKEPPTN
jgi:hypothetical protein